MTARNYDLKTASKLVGTTIATLGMGAVPTAMKRYITMVKVANVAGQQNVLYLASAATSAATATVSAVSAISKYSIQLPAEGIDTFPPTAPDISKPLFSLAAASFLKAKTNKGNARLFVQYYDE